ncbi:MAG: carboxypeptidase regulatory-like domain-containing protein, partial [Holophagales bacterium]|nr:carboxypeptidase regulatory-like domain-containing protein [Holophagales bacterium]
MRPFRFTSWSQRGTSPRLQLSSSHGGVVPRTIVALLLTALLVAPGAFAQSTTAGVQGKVTDPSGGPVANAAIVVTNTQTGLARATETNASGDYLVQGLPPATYRVEVATDDFFAPPMQTVLNVGRVTQLDIQVSLQASEEVVVTADRPILNVTKSEVSTVVDQTQIQELPLINRDFTDLASLAPGAKPKQTGQVDPTKNESLYRPFTIGAGNGRAVNIQIDGGDANDRAVGTWTQGYTAEAIQEFEVITDQYKAEYGRAANGVVNVITKSGTNQLSGSLFGLYRDDNFRTENFSERLSGTEKSPSERQQWGGSLGGPIVTDKFFFFLAYEKVEQDAPTAYSPSLTGFARTSQFAGDSFATSLERDLFTAKLSWNLADNHVAFLRYGLDDNTFSNDQGGALTPEVFSGSSANEGWSLLGNITSTWGTVLNELTIHTTDFENGIVSNTPLDQAITPGAGSADFDFITIQGYDLFNLGRDANTPQRTIQSVDQIRNDVSWLLGDHEIKGGFDYIDATFDESQLGSLEP